MDIAGIQSGLVGMALFDLWHNAVQNATQCRRAQGSPLVAAAAAAFEQYIATTEIQMAAQVATLSTYALQPGGNAAKLAAPADLAPFLALNLLA